ncbi:MAG: S41 family peptidase [Bacteroidales bacterium]|nr:S41 family peptidase [Bacteroidales bacterium]
MVSTCSAAPASRWKEWTDDGMENKKQSWIRIAEVLLGVLLGVVLTLTVVRYRESRRILSAKYIEWRKLNLILDEIEKNYVDTIDQAGMTDAAIAGALAQLDPHSVYLPPVKRQQADEELASNFEGIGIQFNVPNDTAIVLEVIAGGPAEKAGMLPGDRLLKVDDKVIAGVKFPQDSMVRRMKGPSGTKVLVTVGRGRDVIPFEIVRGKIPLHSIDAAFMVDETTGYVRLAKFSSATRKDFIEAYTGLLEQGMKHLMMDLRDNSGGFLEQALLLSNEFLSKGDTIVYMEGLHRPREVFRADGRGKLKDIGLTVLISENSASSSEIFAGAIQDNDRGTIVGRRSFGKGLVQEQFAFTDESGLRLTVARFYTPSGRCIQKPYDDYEYDIYNRYTGGEVFSADSVKLNTEDVHHTRSGRVVYGGGGIMPDVFVPVDTTRASAFYIACNRKTTQMRFAAAMFDKYSKQLLAIDSYPDMDAFLKRIDIPGEFRRFARNRDGITVSDAEYAETLEYLLPQLNALVARYSKLNENAFYKYYLPVDTAVEAALKSIRE